MLDWLWIDLSESGRTLTQIRDNPRQLSFGDPGATLPNPQRLFAADYHCHIPAKRLRARCGGTEKKGVT
jgi:hypothetical protein